MRTLSIQEVTNTRTGENIKSSEFFAQDESTIFKQRTILEEAIQCNKKEWICPICGGFIKIKGKWDGVVSMHFAHVANNNHCPLKENNRFTKDQLLRYRYNGQKEGERHKFLKELIGARLLTDERFSNIKIDKRLNGASDEWRKPDVRAVYEGKRVAFEVQLSTTFLNVIAERKLFYRQNGIYLIWIFDKSHSSVEDMRFTEKDIFFPNHHNAFFVDFKDNSPEFTLTCGYEMPFLEKDEIKTKFINQDINFDDLTFTDHYEAYYYNYDEARNKVELELLLNELSKTKGQDEVKAICLSHNKLFEIYGSNPEDHRLRALICCILSIKNQNVVGYRHNKVIEVLHIFLEADRNKDEHFVQYIFNASKVFNSTKFLLLEDGDRKKFLGKAQKYVRDNHSLCMRYDIFLKALFPELDKSKI